MIHRAMLCLSVSSHSVYVSSVNETHIGRARPIIRISCFVQRWLSPPDTFELRCWQKYQTYCLAEYPPLSRTEGNLVSRDSLVLKKMRNVWVIEIIGSHKLFFVQLRGIYYHCLYTLCIAQIHGDAVWQRYRVNITSQYYSSLLIEKWKCSKAKQIGKTECIRSNVAICARITKWVTSRVWFAVFGLL